MLVWKAIIWVPLQSVNMKLIINFAKRKIFSPHPENIHFANRYTNDTLNL